jgi:glutathione S-transferase
LTARGAARYERCMLRLYDYLFSGNGYKVRLLLTQLGIPFERVELDILRGETRTPGFLAKNPNGRIPVVELEDGTILVESNAILWHFADGTAFLSADRLGRTETLRWMFFEQNLHEPNIATARFWVQHLELTPVRRAALEIKRQLGAEALGVMETHLRTRTFFVGERYSIADIALYAYTHVADEGGFALDGHPAIRAWLARVAAEPGHVPITRG